jgi:O-antigen biosynthesis protein
MKSTHPDLVLSFEGVLDRSHLTATGDRPTSGALPPKVERPSARGKFLFRGDRKLHVRGVTYGTFAPATHGHAFPERGLVQRDFAAMARVGINAVRTYTVPPRWLLDEALQAGIAVMVGLPWEQHITFLDDPGRSRAIQQAVRAGVASCGRHPAVLCYAIGNEIPSSIVRWHGRRRTEQFLERLYAIVKEEDPGALVTYVNYPTTEYLQLPFLDFVAFNVYLESRDRLDAYLSRLHTLAGDRPLVMAEVGLDSRRHGTAAQASVLRWQIETVFASGCAGAFVFAWTDEWHRGGHDIEDWDFGLTTRERAEKPALGVVRDAFRDVPFPATTAWPLISVVVCSYNGARTIGETLDSLERLEYPRYEIIVVDDGSTDATADIATRDAVRLIRTPNGGLSAARNIGIHAASGEIVAFIDDDAYADPHWLSYLAHEFITTGCAAAGGPNLPPPGDNLVAAAVANAPGGPIHVLISDREAEHIPGVNSAYRRDALLAIGGFDPVYRAAGDDVDVCWRLLNRGLDIRFSPAAIVWHHRRDRVGAYWRQQRAYGRAEALLERQHPERYNPIGHVAWTGRLYGNGAMRPLATTWRVYHGTWNSAPFQPLYHRPAGRLQTLAQTPEWYLLTAALGVLFVLGLVWPRLLWLGPVFLGALLLPLSQVVAAAAKATFPGATRSGQPVSAGALLKLRLLTGVLFVLQPLARLWGRLEHGLTLWRRQHTDLAPPREQVIARWTESWRAPQDWLAALESSLPVRGVSVRRGHDYDRFDLYLWFGVLGGIKALLAVEEHGAGRQLLRFLVTPRWSPFATVAILGSAIGAIWAGLESSYFVAGLLGGLALVLLSWATLECAAAGGAVARAVRRLGDDLQ